MVLYREGQKPTSLMLAMFNLDTVQKNWQKAFRREAITGSTHPGHATE